VRIVGFCADCGIFMAELVEEWVISYQGDALICPSCGRVDVVWK